MGKCFRRKMKKTNEVTLDGKFNFEVVLFLNGKVLILTSLQSFLSIFIPAGIIAMAGPRSVDIVDRIRHFYFRKPHKFKNTWTNTSIALGFCSSIWASTIGVVLITPSGDGLLACVLSTVYILLLLVFYSFQRQGKWDGLINYSTIIASFFSLGLIL